MHSSAILIHWFWTNRATSPKDLTSCNVKIRVWSRNGLYYSRKLLRSVKNSSAPTGTFCHPFSPCIPIPHGAIKPSKLNNTGVNFLSVSLESNKPILGRIFWIHTAVGDVTEGDTTTASASTSTNPSRRHWKIQQRFPWA